MLLSIRRLKQRGTALYKLHRYVSPHRVVFLHRFGLKTGIHLAVFDLESGMDFEGTTRVFKVFIVSILNKGKKYANSKCI